MRSREGTIITARTAVVALGIVAALAALLAGCAAATSSTGTGVSQDSVQPADATPTEQLPDPTAAAPAATPSAAAATATATVPPATATPAPATPTPSAASLTTSGRGDDVLTVPSPFDSQAAIVTAKYSGSDNFIVQTLGSDNSMAELLVDTIGNYRGVTAMDFDGSTPAAKLQVTAGGGSWTITFSDPSAAPTFSTSTQGTGDAVVAYGGDAGTAALTNNGQGNFVVTQFSSLGSLENLLVNEIGHYGGRVPIDSGGYLTIQSDGSWAAAVSN